MVPITKRLRRELDRVSLLFHARTRREITTLSATEAYRRWAPSYSDETATSFLDEELAQAMLTGLPRKRLLDAGCGIGRRIANDPNAVGIDLSPAMVATSAAKNVVVGDIRSIPFESDRFDMLWSRLVLGHIPDPCRAYQEFARVVTMGGHVFVTDFHQDAIHAGHRRSFTDKDGIVHWVEHYVHTNHVALAEREGLSLVSHRNGVVGPSVHDFYRRGIGIKAYRRDEGLGLVSAYLFRKTV